MAKTKTFKSLVGAGLMAATLCTSLAVTNPVSVKANDDQVQELLQKFQEGVDDLNKRAGGVQEGGTYLIVPQAGTDSEQSEEADGGSSWLEIAQQYFWYAVAFVSTWLPF